MTASQRAWGAVDDWFAAICRHPFVTGLADGSLPPDVFARYLVDDAHYLDRYARVLSRLAARAPDPAGVGLLAGSAVGAIAAERELHRGFLGPRGLDPDDPAASARIPEPSPTCAAYTGFLESAASMAPFDVALAAVLPCFRVYAEVGRRIGSTTGEDHPYAAWIATYADPDFDAAVRRAEACLDRVTRDEPAVVDAYVAATRFEWMFWDAAWRGEAWPGPAGSVSDASR